METVTFDLIRNGGKDAIIFLLLLANIYQYRLTQTMHRENRENDRSTMMQLFEALALIKEIRADFGKGGGK